jgi:nitroreductase
MTILEIIKKRRSVRDYLDEPVEKEKILKCLEAARLAPSACNAQPWKFIVVDDLDLKNHLCKSAFRGIYKMNIFAQKAPVIIAVVSEKEKFLAKIGGFLRNTSYYLIDLGIACEHFILAATELGLGTCWLGWFNEKQVKAVLNIPKDKKVDVLLSLGYPKEDKLSPKQRYTLEEISVFNRY